MQSKLRFLIIVFVVGFLFYVHDNPKDAKSQAVEMSKNATSAMQKYATEENLTNITLKTIDAGTKFSEMASKVVENIFNEMGYSSSSENTDGSEQ